MSEKSLFEQTGTFLSDLWRGMHAPEDVLSRRRRLIDEFMLVTGAIGFVESIATISPRIFIASTIELAIAASDLTHAGKVMRTPKGP